MSNGPGVKNIFKNEMLNIDKHKNRKVFSI